MVIKIRAVVAWGRVRGGVESGIDREGACDNFPGHENVLYIFIVGYIFVKTYRTVSLGLVRFAVYTFYLKERTIEEITNSS